MAVMMTIDPRSLFRPRCGCKLFMRISSPRKFHQPGLIYGFGVDFSTDEAGRTAETPLGLLPSPAGGCDVGVATFGLATGSVVAGGVDVPGSGVTMNPVGPVTAPLFGSTPSNEPFFKFSTAGIRGRSSRLTGFTTCAVTMNINSLSFF